MYFGHEKDLSFLYRTSTHDSSVRQLVLTYGIMDPSETETSQKLNQ
jgi:hypothetical protein